MKVFGALLAVAACGGSSQRTPDTTPVTPGPVIEPEHDPVVGTLSPPAGPVRASTVSSLPPEGDGSGGPDMPYGPSTPGPSFGSEPLPVLGPQPPEKGCDAAPFITEGKDKVAAGMPAQALALFEKAIVCVHDENTEMYAVIAACQAKLYSRARAHFVRVTNAKSQQQLMQICHGPYF